MDAIVERCAGLDVHLDTVVACVLYGKLDIKPKKEVKTFSTTTKGIVRIIGFHKSERMYSCSYGKYRNLLEACMEYT